MGRRPGKSRNGQWKAGHATPARLLALEVTRDVRVRNAYVRELLDTRRETCDMPESEFAFAQVLAFGVVSCRGTLDVHVNRNLNSPADVKADVRDCLRLSSYEMLFLDKPAHVAVDQGVELVRTVAPRAAGLANAVLRKMAADATAFPWADPARDDRALANSLGVPLWLLDTIVKDHGRDNARAMLEASLQPAPTYLVTRDAPTPFCFACDLSAQLVASLVPLEGDVLEIGAGRGTKTLLMSLRSLEERGVAASIDAIDVHAYRSKLLEERMAQAGIEGVRAITADARDLESAQGLRESYDSVFVDAPCSGTGTLRRHPEIRWRLSKEDVDSLSSLQARMLEQASLHVRPGGVLLYATCSVLEQENRLLVERFLASEAGTGFHVRPIEKAALSAFGEQPGWHVNAEGFFSSLPVNGGPDGHFAAMLCKGV